MNISDGDGFQDFFVYIVRVGFITRDKGVLKEQIMITRCARINKTYSLRAAFSTLHPLKHSEKSTIEGKDPLYLIHEVITPEEETLLLETFNKILQRKRYEGREVDMD